MSSRSFFVSFFVCASYDDVMAALGQSDFAADELTPEMMEIAEWFTVEPPSPALILVEASDADDDYVLINESDYHSALTDFIVATIGNNAPDADALRSQLTRALSDDRRSDRVRDGIETIRTVVRVGHHACVYIGWSSALLALYHRPWIITLICGGAVKLLY